MLLDKKKIAETCANLFAKTGNIVFGYLFGSIVKGSTGPLSDLDIAIFIDSKDKNKRAEIKEEIRDSLEKELNLPDKVDVVVLNEEVPPFLESQIVYGGEPVFSKDEAKKAHYEAQAVSRWLDWKFHQDKINKSIESQFLKPVKPYGK